VKAAASEASAAMATSATATTSATRQGHCWRHQAKGHNRRQRDNRFTQHSHSPSVISLPTTISLPSGDRPGELPAKFAQLHAIRILNLMSGSRLVRALRARCVQQKSPVEANPDRPCRGRVTGRRLRAKRHGRSSPGAFIQPQARFTLSVERCRILDITTSKISSDIKGVPIWL
jgi:hypothetical protein